MTFFTGNCWGSFQVYWKALYDQVPDNVKHAKELLTTTIWSMLSFILSKLTQQWKMTQWN